VLGEAAVNKHIAHTDGRLDVVVVLVQAGGVEGVAMAWVVDVVYVALVDYIGTTYVGCKCMTVGAFIRIH
jgi:hypothetical protein